MYNYFQPLPVVPLVTKESNEEGNPGAFCVGSSLAEDNKKLHPGWRFPKPQNLNKQIVLSSQIEVSIAQNNIYEINKKF